MRPRRLAHCRENPYALLTDWLREPEPQHRTRHEVERQLDLVRQVGAHAPDTHMRFNVTDADRRTLDAQLRARGVNREAGWIVLHPGATERMRNCVSGYAGQDPATITLPGPPTVGIRCQWAPGASGGGWLIEGGQAIDGITTYLRTDERALSFGPYFSATTVGRVVAGL